MQLIADYFPLILFFVASAAVQMALRALEEGNVVSVLGALVIRAAAVYLALRRMRVTNPGSPHGW